MSATAKPAPLPDRLRRIVAGGCAALVFALTIFAASPVAHELLHHSDHGQANSEDACAVVMFASGVSMPVGPLAITPPTAVIEGVSPVTAADVFLVSPRYLRRPERGPPMSRIG